MRIFVFHIKNNGFSMVLNSQLQAAAPTSRRSRRRDERRETGARTNEILKMLTVEAYRKDI